MVSDILLSNTVTLDIRSNKMGSQSPQKLFQLFFAPNSFKVTGINSYIADYLAHLHFPLW